MPGFRVNVQVFEQFRKTVSARWLRDIARRALAMESVAGDTAVGVVVADDAVVRRLNHEYRGLDETTDVLSFATDSQDAHQPDGPEGAAFALPPRAPRLLGEVVISFPQAERQARAAEHSTDREIAHLIVHGVLHLLGHDHVEPTEEAAMREREERFIASVFEPGNQHLLS